MHVTDPLASAQDVKQGQQALWRYQDMIRQLLKKVTSGTPPAPHTLAAHLLSVKDPHTGHLLSHPLHLLPDPAHVSISVCANALHDAHAICTMTGPIIHSPHHPSKSISSSACQVLAVHL